MNSSNRISSDRKKSAVWKRLPTLVVVVMGLAAVAVAWIGYNEAKLSSDTSLYFSLANAARTKHVESSLVSNQLLTLDVLNFTNWLDATFVGDNQTAAFHLERTRPEAKAAFDAWLAQDPLHNPNAPSSPFVMREYVLQSSLDAGKFQEQAALYSDLAQTTSQKSTQYAMASVLLAISLFFGGLAIRLKPFIIEATLSSLSLIMFVLGVIRIVFLEVS
jgi:hypothetical protein